MAKPKKFGRIVSISIEADDGTFVPLRHIPQPKRIVCQPTPCRDGFHYVPDWWGITHYG